MGDRALTMSKASANSAYPSGVGLRCTSSIGRAATWRERKEQLLQKRGAQASETLFTKKVLEQWMHVIVQYESRRRHSKPEMSDLRKQLYRINIPGHEQDGVPPADILTP